MWISRIASGITDELFSQPFPFSFSTCAQRTRRRQYPLSTLMPCDSHQPRPPLPSNPRNRSLRPRPDRQLPQLIHNQHAQRQRQRDKPELNRDCGGAKDGLDAGFHGDEDGDDERCDDTAEEVGVPAFGGEGVGLEDGHALVADGEEVAPLHYYEGYAGEEGDVSRGSEREVQGRTGGLQVDALSGCVEFSELLCRVTVETFGVVLEAEEELVYRDAGVFPHVEEKHGMGTAALSVTSNYQ